MSEYTFLLGSGISLQSGVQSVDEVTEALFEEDYWEHTDQSFIKGVHPSEQLREYYDVSPIQDFIRLIKERVDRYLRSRFKYVSQANYEDLFDIIQQIHQETKTIRDNVGIEEFCKDIEKATFSIRNSHRNYPEGEAIDLGRFSEKALRFIESVIKYGLNERELRGLDVLEQLITNEYRVNLFTLNHDLLLEKLSESLNEEYADGFSEPDGDVRWYEPETWDSERRVKIFKVHGSRNWSLVRHKEKGQTHGIIVGKDSWHAKDSNGDMVDLLLRTGHILTGQKKFENYISGIHGEIHYRFTHHLRNCSNLIISGYGWNDVQLNWKLFDWLYREADNKMIVIHKEPENMAKYSRFLSYSDIERGVKHGKIILIKKWFQEASAGDILQYTT